MSLSFYYNKSIENYAPFEFKDTVLEYMDKEPCFLCGKIHPPKFYVFTSRSFIKDNDKKNILVMRILCEPNFILRKEKKIKKQYTLTILPSFLIPFSRIPLDPIIKSIDKYITDPEVSMDDAVSLMGAENIKTFRLHFSRIRKLLNKWISFLAGQIIELSGKIEVEKADQIKKYTAPLLSRWTCFRQIAAQYLQLYFSLPGTGSIPETKHDQFIHCRLAGAGMSLGP